MTEAVLLQPERVEGQALEEKLSALRSTPEGRQQLASELRWLAERCARYPGDVRWIWHIVQTGWPGGPARALRSHIEGLYDLVNTRVRIAEGLLSEARALTDAGAYASIEVASLEESGAALRSMRDKISSLMEWMNRPPAPPNSERVAASRAALAAGECEDAAGAARRLYPDLPLAPG